MSSSLVAERYAKALFRLSEADHTNTDKVLHFLEFAAELFKVEDFRKILKSPVIPSDVKVAVLDYAINKTNVGDIGKKFTDQIAAAGRVDLFPQIFEVYHRLVNEQRGVAHALVTSAEVLAPTLLTELEKELSTVFSKKLTLENKVNKDLLGGFVVEVGNFAIDMSVKAKLEALAEQAQL